MNGEFFFKFLLIDMLITVPLLTLLMSQIPLNFTRFTTMLSNKCFEGFQIFLSLYEKRMDETGSFH